MSPSFLLFSAFSAVLLGLTVAWDLASEGSVVTLNGIPYYIPGTPYASTSSFKAQTSRNTTTVLGGLEPVTVVTTSSVTFNLVDLQNTVKGFEESDDVWQAGFLSSMFLELNKSKNRDDQTIRFQSLPGSDTSELAIRHLLRCASCVDIVHEIIQIIQLIRFTGL